MFGWLFGRTRAVAPDDMGLVCPVCGRYDWSEQPVRVTDCWTGSHRSRRCAVCAHTEYRFDCEDHG